MFDFKGTRVGQKNGHKNLNYKMNVINNYTSEVYKTALLRS